jgi:hypothetical protein
MKIGVFLVWVALLPSLVPVLAHAEIYKWKDKDGIVRYSDVPPPSNIKNESIGKKNTKAPVQAPATPSENSTTVITNKDGAIVSKEAKPLTKEEAAAQRAKDAEAQKKVDAAKQAELKVRQENCAISRRNLATYTNGGRIFDTDAKGERSYLGDEDIAKRKAEAQRDVEKYCD